MKIKNNEIDNKNMHIIHVFDDVFNSILIKII